MSQRLRGWGVAAVAAAIATALPAAQYRTLDDHFAPPAVTTRAAWERRPASLREHVRASAGLLPPPDQIPLRPEIFGEIRLPSRSLTASRRPEAGR